MNKLIIISILILILSDSVNAYGGHLDTLILTGNEKKISLTGKAYYIKSSRKTDINTIIQSIRNEEKINALESINLGYADEIYWIIIPIQKFSADTQYLLEIKNPHIDLISFYCFDNNKASLIGTTGDYKPFNSRSQYHRNYVWPLELCAAESFVVIIQLDKIGSSLNIPIYIWENNTHKIQSNKEFFLIAVCVGIMILVALYALIVGIYLRQKIYFAYLALVISVALLLFTKEGLSFQFIYPDLPEFNGFFRVCIALITNFSLIFFSFLFLKIKVHNPTIYRILLVIMMIYLTLLISVPFLWSFFFSIKQVIIQFVLALIIAGNMLCIAAAVMSYHKQAKISSFYILAFLALVISGIIAILIDFGWLEYLAFNPILLGSLLEIIVFSLGLSYMMKQINDERNDLAIKIVKQQKESLSNYLQGVEKERERIAGELHDDIGSRLGNLSRLLSAKQHQDLAYMGSQIQNLTHDVRNLSHQLMPPASLAKGLSQAVSSLVADIQAANSITINLQLFDVPENLNAEISKQTYRIIQEALNNIIKHSKATEVDIQIFGHENELVLTIEDNGVGFDLENVNNGIGLNQMKTRASLINASIDINSSPGEGSQLLITVPF
ncbi:MAG TPA: 7TM diverse intracellular signaling domain-containing protein [Cyclobacteriaceae bacterium]|nr:7TM diverse intracellular signaling domain-containing protein [Cyclobacteriaceae bacterium]